MDVLVINAGSSSVKFTCMRSDDFTVLAGGLVERIGLPGTFFTYKQPGADPVRVETEVADTNMAVSLITSYLTHESVGVLQSPAEITAIGHRIVHGGERITAPVLIELAASQDVDMPVSRAVAAILSGSVTIDAAIEGLLTRPFKAEE